MASGLYTELRISILMPLAGHDLFGIFFGFEFCISILMPLAGHDVPDGASGRSR